MKCGDSSWHPQCHAFGAAPSAIAGNVKRPLLQLCKIVPACYCRAALSSQFFVKYFVNRPKLLMKAETVKKKAALTDIVDVKQPKHADVECHMSPHCCDLVAVESMPAAQTSRCRV
eukprot:1953670-Amphidinium_carterae.1